MKVIHGLESLDAPLRKAVVAIGVFDGVHRGHQEILHQTVREARSQGLTPVALTFDIHPSELFAPDKAPTYIASLGQRASLMNAYGGGIEALVVVRFTHAFAGLLPEEFVSGVLEGHLGARHVLVGADFCYGRGRAGNVGTLLHSGGECGFAVTVVPPFLIHDERVSSTQVRRLLREGQLPAALELLGHPFVVQGVVVRGKALGRTLGYPTANLAPIQPNQQLPAPGVYAAYAQITDGRVVRAAVSVGINPTTDSDHRIKVEAFLMDGFAGDLYGESIGIDFRVRVRDEKRFEDLDALIRQMGRDVQTIDGLLAPG